MCELERPFEWIQKELIHKCDHISEGKFYIQVEGRKPSHSYPCDQKNISGHPSMKCQKNSGQHINCALNL